MNSANRSDDEGLDEGLICSKETTVFSMREMDISSKVLSKTTTLSHYGDNRRHRGHSEMLFDQLQTHRGYIPSTIYPPYWYRQLCHWILMPTTRVLCSLYFLWNLWLCMHNLWSLLQICRNRLSSRWNSF